MARTLLAVHAHPDDESITTAGVLAHCAAAGVRTVVVTCTRGDKGEIADGRLASTDNLDIVRGRELEEACRILGVSRVVRLGYGDSGMVNAPADEPTATFCGADIDGATRRLVAVLREEQPDVVVGYDETGGYGHPDHVRAHQLTVAAFSAAGDPSRFPETGAPWTPRKLYFVVFPATWSRHFVQRLREAGIEAPLSAPAGANAGDTIEHFGVPDDRVTAAVAVTPFVAAKRAALAAHRTQMPPDHFLMRMSGDLAGELWAYEWFQLVVGPAHPGRHEDNLFHGIP